MKQQISFILFLLILLSALTPFVQGQDIKPASMRIKTDNDKILATFDALKVRINEKQDEFFSHHFL